MNYKVFICQGWCLLQPIEQQGPPSQITSFEGTWEEATRQGWRITRNNHWTINRNPMPLCPKCAEKAKEKGLL